ncbi:PIN domain-containing protein [Lutibacter citreus]|uniref:PIN domain-containing protein n=1 Tax=Lutibacter citreus TaxID=2138210 RepID=UPI000DBEA193|nr:PIN domain-containing protein [Lutibacter citreus]
MAVIDVDGFPIKFRDEFFFDTNIWLLIFGTVAGYQKKDQRLYSNLLADIISRDNAIYITSMVISEFANVLLRIDFNQWIDATGNYGKDFKRDYVGSESYISMVTSIKDSINKILSLSVLIRKPDDFNSIDINNVFVYFDLVDFNDAYIAEVSKTNGYKVVTNDTDFKSLKGEIDVVTSRV